jgi:hypothetical protein
MAALGVREGGVQQAQDESLLEMERKMGSDMVAP